MASEKGSRKDKNQNIQVFVRLRPLNQREKDIRSLGVVEVVNGREVTVRQSNQSAHTKKFTFDRAFPPHSKQVEVYQEVVSPLIEEVLAGYNCTVFAYGQTGTGKTHTMVGEASSNEVSWQNDPQAGIIPRALSQLFDELRLTNTEYTVRVSYLELYNEELFDLLSTSEDNSKLRIYEDVTRKGSNIVNGLEEITVYNKNEVYKIMAQGQERKKVASTLMNAQSSRSHTVFTIVVHMKENSPEGEELLKIGKLNLVDLAGSENISKAGSDNPAKKERARECVNINQSLLTLGRVITALVERHPHIPYRESKLTRILQESLGGRTKTSIIATISPGHKDLEETMSTLEYANRAKNIQNKPEVNQKMTKKAMLKEFVEEIDRLKRDLQAARDKNGVYLASDTYAEITFKQEEQRKEIQELLLKKRALEEEKERLEKVFGDLNGALQAERQRCAETFNQLCGVEDRLANTRYQLQETQQHAEEQRYIVQKQEETEQVLSNQAKQLLQVADLATNDATCLHNVVDKRKSVESSNLEITRAYRTSSSTHRTSISHRTATHRQHVERHTHRLVALGEQYTEENIQTLMQNKQKFNELIHMAKETLEKLSSLPIELHSTISSHASTNRQQVHTTLTTQMEQVNNVVQNVAKCLSVCLQRATETDVCSDLDKFLQYWHSDTTSRITSVSQLHSRWALEFKELFEQHETFTQQMMDQLQHKRAIFDERLQERLAIFTADKQATEQRITEQLCHLEQDKIQQEKLEDQLLKYIQEQRKCQQERHERRMQEINRDREFEKRINEHIEWLNNVRESSARETQDIVSRLETSGKEMDRHKRVVDALYVDCGKGNTSVSNACNELGGNALEIVRHVKKELVTSLQDTQGYVQKETTKAMETNKEKMLELTSQVDNCMDSLALNCQQAVISLAQEMKNSASHTMSEISLLKPQVDAIITNTREQQVKQTEILKDLNSETEHLTDCVNEEIGNLEQLESKCLNEQYVVYSPTGQTPARRQYNFPRNLAATSPHERIIARFRAMREQNEDSASDITDKTNESEDSAVEPSPKAPEVDIDGEQRRHQDQCKENSIINRSSSFKKPSKLPSFSAKKPLAERN
ncbi:kinesin-like protein Klp61F [Colias croceus]|uniref:kinesin-like protein Klp61F n=1 Tax=Colias crocea TaxID=72248 RepID=UPI001E281587|nr:kinesin-like protein Klp61F [Colias croceus]